MERIVVRFVLSALLLCVGHAAIAMMPAPQSASEATSITNFKRFGVFQTPLVPIGRYSDTEYHDLELAIARYKAAGGAENVAAIDLFLAHHPQSAWRTALLVNEGLALDHAGEFTNAIDRFQAAWALGRSASGRAQAALADVAYAKLLELHAAFSHTDKLKELLAEGEHRHLTSNAQTRVTMAKEGLWEVANGTDSASICGLVALRQLLVQTGDTQGIESLDRIKLPTAPHGLSLDTLQALAASTGFQTRMVYRQDDAPIPVPAVVHWKVGHYATLIAERNGLYHIKDNAMNRDYWTSRTSLLRESSGYFLVPDQSMPGWRSVAHDEAEHVIGAGMTQYSNPDSTSNDDADVSGCGSCSNSHGMAQYSVKGMLVSLSLHDTPIGYTPPKGPAVPVTIVYSQREANQPANFTFFNFGQKWTSNLLSYVQDDPDPTHPLGSNVSIYLRGGGTRHYSGLNGFTHEFTPEERTHAHLAMVSINPPIYERRMPDGSKDVYSVSDGSASYPRRIFLTKIVDRAGNSVTLNYDSQMRLVTLSDAIGQKTTFHYDNAQFPLQMTGITDPFGRQATLDYDASGRLVTITDVIGMKSHFVYDADTFITSMTTPYGTTQFSAGEGGRTRWLDITDPQGLKERVEYRENAPKIPYVDSPAPVGVKVNNVYINARNTFFWDKTAMQRAQGDYTQAHIYHWLHDNQAIMGQPTTSGVLESIKDPLENRIWFSYPGQTWAGATGGFDKPSAITQVLDNGDTQIRRFTYNIYGLVTQSRDPSGRELDYSYATNGLDLINVSRKTAAGHDVLAQFTYNNQHEPLTYTDAAGKTTTFIYNSSGQRTSMTDPRGDTTTYNYDSNGYLQNVVDANGKMVRSFTYDGYGRVATVTDSEGYTLTFGYDALDRPTTVTYPDGTQRSVTWDKLDVATSTDREGRTTVYHYDSVRNLLNKTDPLNQVTQYGYYANGKLHTLTDPNSNTTTWNRDIQGRITSKVYADGNQESYTYDVTGRLQSRSDALDQITHYAYQDDDLLAGISYSNVINATPAVSFTYDPYYPRLTTRNDGQGSSAYSYYPAGVLGAGQLKSEQGSNSHDALLYSYDELGRLAARTVDGAQENYSYDALGRLSNETNPLGVFTTTYLGETAQPTLTTIANVPYQVSYQYEDNLGDRRLKAILNDTLASGTAQPVMDYSYTTSPENLILSRTASNGSGSGSVSRNGWDKGKHTGWDHAPHWGVLDWLTGGTDPGESHRSSQGSAHAQDGTHVTQDTAGSGGGSPVSLQYIYDDALRLTNVQGGSTESYSYDPAGNITQLNSGSSNTSFTINSLNQITSSGASSYLYDANGNLLDDGTHFYAWDGADRLIKITNKLTGHTSQFTYDAYSRRISATETDSGGTPVTSHFLWCGEQLCEKRDSNDGVMARYYRQGELQNGQPLYYAKDQVGTVVADVDASGQSVGQLSYDSYGNITSASGTLPDYRYAGLYYHSASGLSLATYRAYDAKTGRWISRDPIRERGGINLYGYVGSNPIYFVDTFGLSKKDQQAIVNMFYEIVRQMTNDGLRNSNPIFNNTCRSHPWFPGCPDPNQYKDCFEQADYVNHKLEKGVYDAHWAFYTDAGIAHAWGVAVSSDSNDPPIWYDPRSNDISIGEPCPTCHGWGYTTGIGTPARPPK